MRHRIAAAAAILLAACGGSNTASNVDSPGDGCVGLSARPLLSSYRAHIRFACSPG